MPCIHFKFKSSLDYDTIKFDGLNIKVGDLRERIQDVKTVGKAPDFDIQIVNAQSKTGSYCTINNYEYIIY